MRLHTAVVFFFWLSLHRTLLNTTRKVTAVDFWFAMYLLIAGSIRTIVAEEGAAMLAKGWLPTFLGYSAQVGKKLCRALLKYKRAPSLRPRYASSFDDDEVFL